MGKIKRRKRHQHDRKVKNGDQFTCVTDVEFVDVDDDGDSDLIVTHTVTRNGDPLFNGRLEWYLDGETAPEFEAALAAEGIQDETVEFDSFRKLAKYWNRFHRGLKRINDFGEQYATDVLGQRD